MRKLCTGALALTLMLVGSVAAAQPSTAPKPPPAAANAEAEAGTHFQRALELYEEQDFAGALVEFRRAHDLFPTYKLFYNIGQVCFQLNDYACALKNFEAYLKDGGGNVSTERRTEVEQELAKLRQRVGRLEIVTNIPDVDIAIDDVPVGKTPLPSSLVVSTGKRRITGTHEGYAPVSRVVEVAGTDSSRVELVFASASPTPQAPRYESRWNTLSWIGLGTTAARAAGGAVAGVMALGAESDLASQTYADGRGPSSEMKSTQDRANTFSLIADVAFGLSAATLVGTLVYTFVHTPARIEEKTSSGPKLDVRFGRSGAMLTGSF